MKKMKLIPAVLSAAMLAAAVTPVFAESEVAFSDLSDPKYSWAVGYINDMAAQGFISGYEDGTYRPDREVTRLEVLSLFARAMGSNSEANQTAAEAAAEQYGATLEKYNLPYGTNDIAYLLYRGALKESELSAYLKDSLQSQPMPRYEAATIITKALGAEKTALSEVMVDMDYTDAKSIPSKSGQYVYYVTEKGIMSGMGDGSFSPATGVLRSQIAVMLSKTVDLMCLTVEEYKLVSIDKDNIAYKDIDGKTAYMGYSDKTRFYLEGVLTETQHIPVGVTAKLTYMENELMFVDVDSTIPDETVSGIYQGYSSSNGVVTISVQPAGSKETVQYPFAADVTIMRDGAAASIRDFAKTDYITLEISGGKVSNMTGEQKEKKISNATIDKISIVEDGTITISHADEAYDGLTLSVSDDVRVNKNGDTASLADVYKGDIVTLTLEYDQVVSIVARSNTRTVEGTIQSLEISSEPKMTVSVKNEINTYDIPSGVQIFVNGKEGSLYDFRVGDKVTLTLESKAITRISAATVQSSAYSQTGTVTAINSSYGFIKISYNKDGVTAEETVYCKDSTTKFITSAGTSKQLKDIKTGDTVTVRGTMTNGAFEASLVLIEMND